MSKNEVDCLTDRMFALLIKTESLKAFVDSFNPYATVAELARFTSIPYQTMSDWVTKGRLGKNNGSKIYLKDLYDFVEQYGKEQE